MSRRFTWDDLALNIEHYGASRDLDADIYEQLGHQVKRAPEGRNGLAWRWLEGSRWVAIERLTTSIDECSRFIEKRHPDWAWTVSNIGPNDDPHALITLNDEACTDIEGSSHHPAMALAAALCRAEAAIRVIENGASATASDGDRPCA